MTLADALTLALCNSDDTMEHHEQTDEHPCSRCTRQGRDAAAALLAPGGWFEGLAQEDCVCGHRADDHSWSGCLIVNAKTEVSCGCKHRPTEALVATLRTTA